MRINIDDAEYDENYTYTYQGEPFTGELIETAPDGTLLASIPVVEGIPNGLQRAWHVDGSLQRETHVVDGRAVGQSRSWHRNGRLAEEQEFDELGREVSIRRWAEDGSVLTS